MGTFANITRTTSVSPLIGLCIVLGLLVYRYIIFPAFLSPLSKIPNAHWSAAFSRCWILWYRSKEEETPVVHSAHQRFGPIIRIAPNEVSVNCIDGGLRNIYAGGYEKGDWYRNAFNAYGVMPMFTMPDHGAHSKRKRMLSNVYAKTTLQSSQSLTAITDVLLRQRLRPRLDALAKDGQPVESYHLFCATTLDFVSAYIFGMRNGSGFVQQPEMGAKFFRDYKGRQRYQFWPQELPRFTAFLGSIGLGWLVVPNWVNDANEDIETWLLSMCDKAEETLKGLESGGKGRVEDYPTVYAQLRDALFKESKTKSELDLPIEQLVQRQRLEVASELLDHTAAGFDTSSITLTFLAWELSRLENKHWQDRLRAEISDVADKHDAKAIDSLPVLHAILMETLRLHAAIPGNQPRITPPSAVLGSSDHQTFVLPTKVRVQSQAWSLHRNPAVFPNPETWNPARWLESSYASSEAYQQHLKEMSRWFWAFGSGGRMCVGANLAMYGTKAIVVAVWGEFVTEIVHADGMVHRGGYVAEPVGDAKGRVCVLNVEKIDKYA